ncbi:hypothetical protein F4553_004377 [Allocatelliglobosispora scoriae]|uniref:non-specific serine/threonine protein kinase n=1 Tax=Allocatelliglobosispora scoriae TaxID=643052 RepID=A0A841BU76_9ACTN|nr:protein kinase family protein [Allocatelliglobosispora scoriae]MBB5870998.1 hypothetical protein [Allocatelliglobosispora scoriae]
MAESRHAAAGAPGTGRSLHVTGTAGEILAERYRLEEHINNDSAGRQVWRGVDIVLKRPVAVVLRYPGGNEAGEMLSAAVTASRVVHGNLIGVYDAIDEGGRAYVVREWVDGFSLRELVTAEGPFDPERATALAHNIASAVTALHASGMAHGNVHPGTVLVGDDGRVVLADARADARTSADGDVRAIGGILYYALTGQWPHAEAGVAALPDAIRDANNAVIAPRQVRAGVPTHLDDLTTDLLDAKVALPSASVLTAELARLDTTGDERSYGTLRFAEDTPEVPRQGPKKLLLGVGAVVLLAAIGIVIVTKTLTGSSSQAGPTVPPVVISASPATANPKALVLGSSAIRLVDPDGNRSESRDIANAIDNKSSTAWSTDRYKQNLGTAYKPGMGLLLDLGAAKTLSDVQIELNAIGASIQLLGGANDPGVASDSTILSRYTKIGEPFADFQGTSMHFGADATATYRYLLVWITGLPQDGDRFRVGIQEIIVRVP